MADALERLRNRQRPEVPLRDATLTPGGADTSTSSSQNSRSLDISTSELQTPKDVDTVTDLFHSFRSTDTLMSRYQDIENSSDQDLKVSSSQESRTVPELKTKQTTMRLEAEISDRLQEACRVNGLSREVLIEALFLQCEANLQSWQSVIAEAKQRAERRQNIANLRRAQSMMEKFGNQ